MTEQKLREELAFELCLYCQKNSEDGTCVVDKPCQASLVTADQILTLLKEAGYVRLSEDQTLPAVPPCWQKIENEFEAFCSGQNSLLGEGWQKVIQDGER